MKSILEFLAYALKPAACETLEIRDVICISTLIATVMVHIHGKQNKCVV